MRPDWIGFDLDDTLHFYRKATSAAMAAVFARLGHHLGVPSIVLEASYRTILATTTRDAFADGRDARSRREERFYLLMQSVGVSDSDILADLVAMYEPSLERALELRPGVAEVLCAIRQRTVPIAVVSEGPHDAQEWTLRKLGIASSIDLLITSGQERCSKADGLLAAALRRMDCRAERLLYVGDSWERDVVPAQALGIRVLWLCEHESMVPASRVRDALGRITTLGAVLRHLSDDAAPSRGEK